MRSVAEILAPHERPPRSIWGFLLGSFLAHLLILLLWEGAPPSGMPGGGVLQVSLAPGVSKALDADGKEKSLATAQVAKFRDTVQQVVQTLVQNAPVAPPEPLEAQPRTDPAEPREQKSVAVQAVAELRAKTRASVRVSERRQASNRPANPEPSKRAARKASPATAAKTRAEPKALEQSVQKLARRSSPAQVGQQSSRAAPAGASLAAGEQGGMGGDSYRRVQEALRKALLPRFDYPMLARRRGWQGRVRVSVLVAPDGDLRDIRVVESCGYQILDKAALEDLREVERLPDVDVWLGGKEISVILPIQYRLK